MKSVWTVKWKIPNVKEENPFSRRDATDDLDFREGQIEPFNLFGFDDPTPAEADELMQNPPKY